MHRTLNLTLLSIALAMMGALNAMAYDFEVGGLYYNDTSDEAEDGEKTVQLTRNPDSPYTAQSVVVPSTVTYSGVTYIVESIGEDAFRDNVNLSEVIIPNTVFRIYDRAFSGCQSLSEITIPSSVEFIDSEAFADAGLTHIEIPNVRSIGSTAFGGCQSLASVTLSASLYFIGEYTFAMCQSLTKVEIPNSVSSIGAGAFQGCGITEIVVPDNVRFIGEGAFRGCQNLVRVKLPEGDLREIEAVTFQDCASLSELTIPNTVYEIKSRAFHRSGLTKIVVPNTVRSIGEGAFGFCENLVHVTLPEGELTTIEARTFSGCKSLAGLTIPNTVYEIKESAFEMSGLTEIVIPNSVMEVDGMVFYGCRSLAHVTLSENMQVIKDRTFLQCIALTSLITPENLTGIGYSAFEGCRGLADLTLSNVYRIEDNAFANCTGMKKISCLTVTPPECGNFVFNGVDKETCTLFVPEEVAEVYKRTYPWSEFLLINAATGVDAPVSSIDFAKKIFNLNGVQLTEPQSGLNIINGKAVLVK